MKGLNWLVLLVFVGIVSSCGSSDFQIYSDLKYAELVDGEFERRKELARNRAEQLFSVMDKELSANEEQGLKFLFAFMPLNDLADYDGEFFLKQVQSSLAARDTFHWGESIPEDEFRHFVLPYRINNENLDTARQVFFDELKDRIKDMDMLEAALEVNHWCHEKVTYRGTDIRTSSPLAAVKTAYGRCGEESTFTAAALRSVAIPARQVYTPRWAHSDDNHAWVEFWANGEWHYLGACEPAVAQNMGWFTEPARRAMLIHTKAFGEYLGTARVANQEPQYAMLNTLSDYAPVKELFVKVLDEKGQAVNKAEVEFQLYNYAEFYPIAIKTTDEDGLCSFQTGLGDLQVWAHDFKLFDYKKIAVAEVDTLVLTLSQKPYAEKLDVYDLTPPIIRDPFTVSKEGKKINSERLKEEDAIRGAYEATFMAEDKAHELAHKLDLDSEEFAWYIDLSRGNYKEIQKFFEQIPADTRKLGMLLLEQISLKDLGDTKAEILKDHLSGALAYSESKSNDDMFLEYVLNPRVSTEMLVAYREYLLKAWTGDEISKFKQDPENLISWIKDNITLNKNENYYETAITPVGVYELKVADEFSTKIFAVSALRTLGYPARLEPGTEYAQYHEDGNWVNFHFGEIEVQSESRGILKLMNNPDNAISPKYHIHFSIAKFKNGKYHTLHFDWDKPIADFADGVELDTGSYLLITGNRQPGGAVLSEQKFFSIGEGETISETISLRTDDKALEVIATINLATTYQSIDDEDASLSDNSNEEWQVIAWIDPDKEPTKRTFQDLPLLKKELDELNIPFTFIVPEEKLTDSFKSSEYNGLPENHRFLIAKDLKLVESIELQTKKKLTSQLPVFVICNAAGEVIYLSSGYKIGIGEEIIKMIR